MGQGIVTRQLKGKGQEFEPNCQAPKSTCVTKLCETHG